MRMTARNRIAGLALIVVVGALVAGPATALAQDALSNPSAAQYEPKSQVQGTTTTGDGPAVAKTASSGLNGNVGSLPFTGMDVIVLAVVSAALIGTGVALRRLSAPRTPKV